MIRKITLDGRVLVGVVLASTVATAFLTDYLLQQWLVFAVAGEAIFGWFIPRSVSIVSALWAGVVCGVGLDLLAALFQSVYGG